MKNRIKKFILKVIILFVLLLTALALLENFFERVDFIWQQPIYIQTPLKIEQRVSKITSPLSSQQVEAKTEPEKPKIVINGPIEQEILDVFGEAHFNKAMLLLKGNGPDSCAENRKLNPEAVHINNNGSKDIGIFQINNYWQKVGNEKFLKDPSINIRIAYRLFVDNGNTFKLWSCGKVYGI